MIRSTKCSLKFLNKCKNNELQEFIDEYRRVCLVFINVFWNYELVPKYINKEERKNINSWISARAIQMAGQQASAIVRGARIKQDQRIYRYNELIKEGKIKNANILLKVIKKNKVSIPKCNTINPELDSRFFKIDKNNSTSFDIWITLKSITHNRRKIKIPIKRTKHFNKMYKKEYLKSGVRIGRHNITFMFEINKPTLKTKGEEIGLDMGVSDLFYCSNGIVSKKDCHNHDMSSIQNKLSKKKKGSKSFKRAQEHRTNFINWSINQLNLKNIKILNIENLKNVRKNKRYSRKLSHWTYAEIKDKIIARCEENGVRLVLKPYAYSSQRCSECGWTQKSNRKRKVFKCKKCNFCCDSDLNASININLNLPEIDWEKMQMLKNLDGFFYYASEQECIVPVSQNF